MAAALRIALVLRSDYKSKPGGDVSQALAYRRMLETAGHQCEVVSTGRSGRGADVALVFNVDRMSEWVRNTIELDAAGIPYVAVPIHHPFPWVTEFERRGRSGMLAASNALLRSPESRDRMRDLVRSRTLSNLVWHLRRRSGLTDMVRRSLHGAAAIAFIADGERRALVEDVGLEATGVVLQNGVDASGPVLEVHRDIDVLVVGRVEERKNQVRVAQALASSGLAVVFAGVAGRNRYGERFQNVVQRSDNLRHIGHLGRDALWALYRRTRVSLSMSWVEVSSLVDLEAHVAGCQVIASERGFSTGYGIESLRLISPLATDHEIREACQTAVNDWRIVAAGELADRADRHSWERSAAGLVGLVASAVGERL